MVCISSTADVAEWAQSVFQRAPFGLLQLSRIEVVHQSKTHNFLQQLLLREAVGTDIGGVITNHRCRLFLSRGLIDWKSPEVTETVIRSLVRLERGVYWQAVPTY